MVIPVDAVGPSIAVSEGHSACSCKRCCQVTVAECGTEQYTLSIVTIVIVHEV